MTRLQTEFPYWNHLFTERIHVGKVIRPEQPAPLNSVAIQTANAKLMPKNGVQQMTKRPMTTATVVALRKSWNKSNIAKFWLIIKSLEHIKPVWKERPFQWNKRQIFYSSVQKSRSTKRWTENINVILKAGKESREKKKQQQQPKRIASVKIIWPTTKFSLTQPSSVVLLYSFFCGLPSSDHHIALFTVRFFVLLKPPLVSCH